MNPNLVLILSKHHPVLLEMLHNKGFQTYQFLHPNLENLEIPFESIVGIVTSNSCFLPKDKISLFPNLKVIGRLGSGMEIIDVAYAESKGILCFGSPEGNANAVAEHALGMLLSLINNLHRSQIELSQGVFERNGNMGRELYDLKVGIIGYGANGSRFAQLLQHFGTQVFAYDIEDKAIPATTNFHFATNHNEIIQKCDCISFHIPINAASQATTFQIMQQMQQPYILLNCARGGLVPIDFLYEQLHSGKIIGAAIDVWEQEPLTLLDDKTYQKVLEIIGMRNVIATPHIAGYTHQAFYKMSKIIGERYPEFIVL